MCVFTGLSGVVHAFFSSLSSLQASPPSVQSSVESACAFLSCAYPLDDLWHLCMPQSPALSGVSEARLELKISKAAA